MRYLSLLAFVGMVAGCGSSAASPSESTPAPASAGNVNGSGGAVPARGGPDEPRPEVACGVTNPWAPLGPLNPRPCPPGTPPPQVPPAVYPNCGALDPWAHDGDPCPPP